MINANLIVRRIDSTCDIVGGVEGYKTLGFQKTMGYIQLLRELNNMPNEYVANIIYDLYEMEGVYRLFAFHILNDGVLGDKFFNLNDELDESSDNVKRLFNEKVLKNKNNNEANISLGEVMNKENEDIKKLYEKNNKPFKNASLESMRDETLKNTYNNSQNKFELEYEKRKEKFKSKINPTIYNWVVSNVPNLSDEDYGMLMSLIYKTRNGEER